MERVLAQGPHGRVYRARNEAGQPAALKELQFAAVPAAAQIDAFEREAATLKTLNHLAIPRFIRNFSEGSGVNLRLYLASEFIEGESLAARINRAPLSEPELFAAARQVLTVLAYLHDRSPPVIHRDIKPDNILLRPDGSLVLVDFGSARGISGPRTYNSTLVGTFGYMPIEQLGGTVDRTSDLYALGATLLHAATGQPPSELLRGEYGLKVAEQVPSKLRPVIERMLQVRPERRFPNAAEALQALDTAESSAVPVSFSTEPKRSLRMRGFGVGILGIGLAAVLGMIALPRFIYPDDAMTSVATQSGQRASALRTGSAPAWFARAKPFCNSVEVSQLIARNPPPSGWEGAGYAAGCLALAGKIEPARALLTKLQGEEQWRAAGIVFNLAHGVADSGDDVAASPVMKLVLAFWPNHYQAMYHAGMSDYALGDYASAKQLLESFLELYHQEDGFRHNAQEALARIGKGLPPTKARSSHE
ncbi:MAG TPA: protein kinase [Myxococcaceae bacterium]|nr:protein kinase [Myxococcaceae bacterium]